MRVNKALAIYDTIEKRSFKASSSVDSLTEQGHMISFDVAFVSEGDILRHFKVTGKALKLPECQLDLEQFGQSLRGYVLSFQRLAGRAHADLSQGDRVLENGHPGGRHRLGAGKNVVQSTAFAALQPPQWGSSRTQSAWLSLSPATPVADFPTPARTCGQGLGGQSGSEWV